MAILDHPEPLVTPTTRSLTGLTDAELVAEVRRGCERAFEQLYARYHRRIAAYIYGMVNDYGRAEDIAQDVFMSALRRMKDTDRPIAFKPWIYEIAKNACIDQFRRSRRSEEVSYDAEEGLAAADHRRLVTTGPAPDVAVDQKLALDHLCGAFGGLSQTHHEILVMRELEGLSYREIGERLGMSRPAVESTLFRARRRLGEEYQELVSGERCQRVQGIITAAAGAAVPGARDQRRLAAHLSHCQSCRRHARVAGLDPTLVVLPRGARAKIAAFFPLPAFLRRRWFGEEATSLGGNHHVSSLAHLSAQVGSTVDPGVASWGRAAVAAATLAFAGVAGGAAVSDETRRLPGGGASPPAAISAAPAVAPAAGTTAPAGATPARAGTAPGPVSRPASGSSRRGGSSSGGATTTTGSGTGTGAGAGAGGSGSGSGSGGATTPGTPSSALPGATPALPSASTPSAPATPSAPRTPASSILPSLDPSTTTTGGGRPTPQNLQPALPAAVPSVPEVVEQTTDAVVSNAERTTNQVQGTVEKAADAATKAAESATGSLLGG